jgi:cytoskeletal protein CcmA (bactofilin family)
MGSLSNLYVSQSYQSLLHLASDTNITASTGYVSVEDGKGYPLGFAISSSGNILFSQSVQINNNLSIGGNFNVSGTFDIEGKVTVNDNVRVNGNLEVSGSTNLTGSLIVSNNITASNINVTGTLTANKVVTLIESSSIIYSSGSNILGDETSDTQTLIGSVIISGSGALTGSMGISGNLNVGGQISSSTINGIGNVTTYSASVQSNVNTLFTSASLALVTASFNLSTRDLTLIKGNNTSFSLNIPGTLAPSGTVSSSAQIVIYDTDGFANFNDSIQFDISQKLFTSSFEAYSSSIYNGVQVDGSLTRVKGGLQITGSMSITGSMIYSGSVRGQVRGITINSNTASMDCSLGNFFTVTLPAGTTRFEATNIQPGETLSLKILNSTSASAVSSSTSVKFPTGFSYVPTSIAASTDIITFLSFDTGSIFAVAANYFA